MRSYFIFAALFLGCIVFKSAPVEARHHCHNSFAVSFSQTSPNYYCPPPVYVYNPAPVCYQPVPSHGNCVVVPTRTVVYERPVRTIVYERPVMAPRFNFGFGWGWRI